ncbi:MAG: GNAT family N-acetyltransferase [Clostridia bacterium]|nr:GNAT family N-acetyltransferase [Clostridia bacterium]
MEIRKAEMGDLPIILEIYADARRYMRENGNPHQWGDGYPSEDLVRKDIAEGICHVCVDRSAPVGVFVFFEGEDPTYQKIYSGAWENDRPYGVIHRIAVAKHCKGVASFCFAYAFEKCKNVKIDTHRDNIPMQRSLLKNGFVRCGIIYLENGDERIAFQRSEN